MVTTTPLTVSQVAQRASEALNRQILPRDVTAMLYHRRVDVDRAPIVSGRRLIDPSLVPTIVALLANPRTPGRPRRPAATV
jgi:hypothetical protein